MLVHSPEEPPIPPSDAADCRLNCMRAVAATVHTKTDLPVLSFAALTNYAFSQTELRKSGPFGAV
jgi:hypothetical protein